MIAAKNDKNIVKLNNPIELPSLEEIAQWDKQREEAIAALEISADDTFVKCQNCSQAIPIVGRLLRPKGSRIDILQRRIRHLEERYHRGAFSASVQRQIKNAKEELQSLQAISITALLALAFYCKYENTCT